MTIQQAFELALQHHQCGRLVEAEALYRQVLAMEPRHADALHHLGIIGLQTGNPAAGVELISQAIILKPDYAEAHSNLGIALKESGLLDQAIAAYRRATALKPGYVEAHYNLGNTFKEKGQLDEAAAAYRRVISLKPSHPESHGNLGNVLKDKGQTDAAIAAYRQAIVLKPTYAEAHSNLGNALEDKGDLDLAIAAHCQAIALKANYPEAHTNLGNTLRAKGQLDAAIAAHRQAIALKPDLAEAHTNLGAALGDTGQLEEAIAAHRRAIALKPGFPDAHHNLGLALLLQGNFLEGWEEMEWRWKRAPWARVSGSFAQPRWEGGPIEGRTILLKGEQGIGDVLQFIRYAPMVAQRGGRIIIQCQPQIKRLLQMMAPDLLVFEDSDVLPAFDTYCPLMSLPRLFATELAGIPRSVPYLHADAGDARVWRNRLAEHSPSLKAGLVWAGNPAFKTDRLRSPRNLSLYVPLGAVAGAEFFSLQKGDAASQCRTPPAGLVLHDWTDGLRDFADTAALMENLDLVITSDTSVAHLAGAMGRPVWVLLPFSADWRWLRERSDSPWYPSMRLFRQRRPLEWEPVVEEVRGELEKTVRSREGRGWGDR